MILLRIFKDSRTLGMAGLVIVTLALFMKSFIQPGESGGHSGLMEISDMPFYNMIFGEIHFSPIFNRIVTLVLLFIISYMLIRIGVRYVLLEFRSLMPAFFFIMFSMALPSTQQVNPALVGSLFYLFCFAILFDVQDKRPDTFSVFSASLMLALGSMFYLKLIWFVPLIWMSLSAMRSVTWRELFYPVVAYLLLGLFLFTWYWVLLNDSTGFLTLIGENLAFTGSFEMKHSSEYIYYGYFLLMVLVASVYMVNRFQARKTVIQNIFQVMFYMFVAGLLFFLFVVRFDTTTLIFISFPVSFILSNYFHRKKNHWSHELALWVMVGLLVFVQLMA